jgi:beta-carotene 3-hydroxylase
MVLFITILVTAVLMEGVAWAMHKYIMHGVFWNLHEDHHVTDKHDSFFELNDSFFVFFAIISISAFVLWTIFRWDIALGVGIGVLIYGIIYFVIHDLFIHQRIKIWRNTKNPYLLAIRRAHKIHHKHLGKKDGECFGMLWVPMKYYRGEY